MSETVVIVPTYNERENIVPLGAAVRAALPAADLLFVDDNSPDGTAEAVQAFAKETDPGRVHLLSRAAKQGLGPAYVAGFQYALARPYQHIVQMDADLSHDPAAIPRMLQRLANHDLVVGSRYIDGIRVVDWPLSRLLLSRTAGTYTRLLLGLPVRDPTSGFVAWRREALAAVLEKPLSATGYSFLVEMKYRAWMRGFSLAEDPIVFHERRSGMSKMDTRIIREATILMWKIAWRNGFRRRPQAAVARSHEEPSA